MVARGNAALYAQIGSAGYDMAMAFGNSINQASVNRKIASMNAETYRSQARLNILAMERQNAYLNEASAQNVWNSYDNARLLQGSQRVAMAASGFTDISSGDYRLLRDTAQRADKAATGMNRTTYLQAFENERAAMMEANRLEYAARAQDAIRKQNSSGRAFLSGSFAALGAFAQHAGSLMQTYTQGASMDVAPTRNGQIDLGNGIRINNMDTDIGSTNVSQFTMGATRWPMLSRMG